MLYLTIKVLHVVAIIVWIGGMLLVALLLASIRPAVGPFLLPEHRLLAILHRWDRWVTAPAMVSAWVLGLAMAELGHWFVAAWFFAKLIIVLALTGLHGIQARILRRLVGIGARRKPIVALRFAPLGILLCVGIVVALVVLKPF